MYFENAKPKDRGFKSSMSSGKKLDLIKQRSACDNWPRDIHSNITIQENNGNILNMVSTVSSTGIEPKFEKVNKRL